ncbi:MAG TPA: AAA family ATPase [Mycobacteriales bacterium]|nr:AAA family ATPase [Mycobacteriales bacterium]
MSLACATCGTPAVPGARFCFHCGAPMAPTVVADLAERRIVTVLFGDLSDFTAWAEDLDPERVGSVTDRLLQACADAVTAVGGHVDKLTGDGIMAVFGAPTAHEDDAERAVRAAAAMRSAVEALGAEIDGRGRRLGLRVGLNTGEVLAGVQAGHSYTVIGDTVNTAARLSDAAGAGAVIAGKDTALATMDVSSWRALPPLRLKGKREPVPAYELVGLRTTGRSQIGAGEEAPLIGRDAEVAMLVSRLRETAEAARPATLLITGEAGLGKTRLGHELTRQAAESLGARVLWGRCAPYGVGRDLSPIVHLVRMACGVGADDDADAAEAAVRRTLGRLDHPSTPGRLASGLTDRLMGLLGFADDLSRPGSQLPAATPGEPVRATAEIEAVASMLRGFARQGPVLLVIDDLQWASDSTLALVASLAAQLSGPALVLGLGRTELLSRGSWWRELPRVEVLPLAPLDEGAAELLLRAYLRGGALTDAVREEILTRAQGNPFFLAELLHLLVDRGLLHLDTDKRWALADALPDDVLPAGVQSVLAARIDSLDPIAKAVLRDAAVLGARVPVSGLIALSPAEEDEARAAIDVLVARQMLAPEPGSPAGTTYVFPHALGRDVAYASMAKVERAHRHALAARWAATGLPPGPEADQDIATHAGRAIELATEMSLAADDPAWDVRADGFSAYARLGHAALARDDNRSAERLFRLALDMASALPAAAAVLDVRVALAQSLAAQWRTDEAEDLLAPALDWESAGVRAHALMTLGDIRRKQGREDEATQAWVAALAAAGEAGLDAVAGEVMRNLGLQDYLGGRLHSADERFREALALARRVGDARGAGWALQHLAWAATTRGDYSGAEEILADAAAVFVALDDIGGLAWCSGTEGFVRVLQGRLREARELIQALLPASETFDDTWATAACLTIDALAAAELGALTHASEDAARAEQLFASLQDTWGAALALTAHGMAARGGGHSARAIELLTHAESIASEARLPMNRALAATVLGYTLLEAGDVDAAAGAATRAASALDGLDLEPAASTGVRVLHAQVVRARGDLDAARAELEACVALFDDDTLFFPRRQGLAHLAGVLVELGEGEEALVTAERALAVPAEDVRSQVLALRALGSAKRLLGDLDGARSAYTEALAVATSTEQCSEVAPTERALAVLSAG